MVSRWVLSCLAACPSAAGCKNPESQTQFADEGTAGAEADTTAGDPDTTGDGTTEATSGPTAGDDDDTGDDDDDADDTTAGGADTTGGIKLDVGFDTEGFGTAGPMGCEKIDFLFVIDNSGSMRDNQEALIEAFPGFIQAIQDNVQGTDHHIMVIDSDENPAWLCEEFLDGAHCDGSNPQPNDCNEYVCGSIDDLGECAVTLGAGVVHPVGGYASNMDCDFPPGRRYLTSEDADLVAKFSCAALVGISGNGDEYPMTAMVDAVGDTLGAADACNEGFLRDDAILVVTVVSDDPASPFAPDDDASAGDPMVWYDGLVAAKNDDPDAIAVIGLVPWMDTSCVFENVETERFVDFVELFGDKGVLGSVCAGDYADVFAQTIAVIDTTCDEFEPEG